MDSELKTQFESLVSEILQEFGENKDFPEDLKHTFERQIRHVMPNHNLALTCFTGKDAFKTLRPDATETEISRAGILGWCMQMVQAYTIILDDFVDNGDMRYGKPTWSKLHNHNPSIVVHDALLLQTSSFYLLKKHFGEIERVYVQLIDLINEAMHNLWKGEKWNTRHNFSNYLNGTIKLEDLDISTYRKIGHQRFTWHALYLQIAGAMILAGYDKRRDTDQKIFESVLNFCDTLGHYCMVKDDYFDCFAENKNVDTLDSDIRQGQFSWLFIMAKENCTSEEQWSLLKDSYGKDESVTTVKKIYEDINLPKLYEDYVLKEKELMLCQLNRIKEKNDRVAEMLQRLVQMADNAYDTYRGD